MGIEGKLLIGKRLFRVSVAAQFLGLGLAGSKANRLKAFCDFEPYFLLAF